MNSGLICIPVCAKTADELVAQLHRAEPLADIIEVRFDCLDRDQIAAAIRSVAEASLSTPLIATFRSPEQGGNDQSLTAFERAEFSRNLPAIFTFADLEQDVIDAAPTAQLIASEHDFTGVPTDLKKLYERLASETSAVIKIAATAHDICDAIPIWKLLENARVDNRQIIPVAMGDAGKWTRILGLAQGAFLTYASLDAGKETAGGQLSVEELFDTYRVKQLDRDTRVYGVIGDPVTSSLSPYMHNAAFAACGINAVFLPLQVKDLDEFMRRMVLTATREVELNFSGFSVTMPHKRNVQHYLTRLDPVAEKIGAVNTIKIDGDVLTGYNTDAPGFLAPLNQRIPDLKHARVAILGAGGAARAVVYALQQEGAEITLLVRDRTKARPLANEFNVNLAQLDSPPYEGGVDAEASDSGLGRRGGSFGSDKLAQDQYHFDIIVNATPLGMRGPNEDKTPLTADDLSGVRFVYDLVTRADDTPLIREAKRAGISTIGGAEMLISQGIKQFEIWTGRDAPEDLMRQAILDRLK